MITGSMLRDAIISASNNINNHRVPVDALNVFPVPDGDTGTNMSMTMSAAAREVSKIDDSATVSTVARVTASALLRGARGNSGVILSLIFRGISKGLKGCNQANGATLEVALTLGVDSAYKAVMTPTEGTILTVVRMAAESASDVAGNTDASFLEVWQEVCEGAQVALLKTPSMLPVLKKAGVVDAGGQGLVYIFEGMRSVFEDSKIIELVEEEAKPVEQVQVKEAVANASGEIEFGYCTEFIVNREPTKKQPVELRDYLQSIGDCVVVVDDEEIIKVHVHTNNPGNAIQAGIEYGQLVSIKIENMRQQHVDATWGVAKQTSTVEEYIQKAEPVNKYGFVAVAAGKGIEQLFNEVGVDNVVSGGQSMNPSTEDILKAIYSTPAKHVFVLPNNKNIVMAAQQTIPLVDDREVIVIESKTIPQGVSAMLKFDPDAQVIKNKVDMSKCIEKVSTVSVTYAARNSVVNNQQVKKGKILGIENGKITIVEDDMIKAAFKATKHLYKKSVSVITIIYGEDVTQQQAEELYKNVSDKFPSAEILLVEGNQPVYYFLISLE